MNSFTKITTGWVSQYYEKNEDGKFVCVGQEFECGDLVSFEDCYGEPIEPIPCQYQLFEMVQPESVVDCVHCESCSQCKVDVKWREQMEEFVCEDCYQLYLEE